MKTIEFNNHTYYLVPTEPMLCSGCCFKDVCTSVKNYPVPRISNSYRFVCSAERSVFKETLIEAITHRLTK